jgi:hypothetical protein
LSLLPHISWWADPVRPRRYLNLSPITLSLAAVTALDIALIVAARAIYPDARTMPTPIALLLGIVALSLFCAAPLGLVSLIRDRFAGGRLARKRAAEQALADAVSTKAQDDLVARGLVRDLRACYQTHHQTLVEQARLLLVKNRYGRHDTAAFTAELEQFQQHVVRPELAAKGYPEARIFEVFEENRETLIRTIIEEAR